MNVKDERTINVVVHGSIGTDAKQSHGQRLRYIRDTSLWLRDEFGVGQVVAREGGFSRFAKETQALYKVHGVIEEVFHEYTFVDYAATTVKKTLTGSGRASKDDVATAVRAYLAVPNMTFETNDETDALAVAITHLIKTGGLEGNTSVICSTSDGRSARKIGNRKTK